VRLAAEVLDTLDRACADLALPRVRALHLPPAPWNGSKDGEFAALELEDGSLGLSYVLLDGALEALASGGQSGEAAGADPLEIAQWWIGPPGAQRTIGFAAVNALTRHLFDRAAFVPPSATDSIGGLAPRAGEHVGMVGLFPPLLRQVTACGARLTVLELKAELAGDRPGYRVTLDPGELESCDKVLATSTVLLNDTVDEVLAHCRRARALAMIGPGAGCLPDALFKRGVTLVGGTWIENPEGLKLALATGAPWGGHTRKFALTPGDYPGVDALQARTA
jgi:hypothetical protein